MLDDPLDFPRPYQPRPQQHDFRDEFWERVPDMRSTEARQALATFRVCRYIDGHHEVPRKPWCPHYREVDG